MAPAAVTDARKPAASQPDAEDVLQRQPLKDDGRTDPSSDTLRMARVDPRALVDRRPDARGNPRTHGEWPWKKRQPQRHGKRACMLSVMERLS